MQWWTVNARETSSLVKQLFSFTMTVIPCSLKSMAAPAMTAVNRSHKIVRKIVVEPSEERKHISIKSYKHSYTGS